MNFVMILLYIVISSEQPPAYKPVYVQKLYSTREECVAAGKALTQKALATEKVAEVVLGVCLPSEDKAV